MITLQRVTGKVVVKYNTVIAKETAKCPYCEHEVHPKQVEPQGWWQCPLCGQTISKDRNRFYDSKCNAKSWPTEYTMENFLEQGAVSYEDVSQGVALLEKPTIDSMLNSFIGKPVIIDHKDIGPDDMMKYAQGWVTQAYFNAVSGKYDLKFILTNDDAKKKVENGWSGSCAFDVYDTDVGGEWHAIKYNERITAGGFTHLALVTSPRYEDCRIIMNSKGVARINKGGVMKGIIVKIGEELVPLETILSVTNSKAAPMELAGDQEIALEDGTNIKVSDLVAKYNDAKKNETPEEKAAHEKAEAEAAEAAKHKNDDKKCAECGEPLHEGQACNDDKKNAFKVKNDADAEALKIKENEKKAAEEAERVKKDNEKKAADEAERVKKENAKKAEDAKRKNSDHFVKLNRISLENGQEIAAVGAVDSLADKCARGRDRYSKKA